MCPTYESVCQACYASGMAEPADTQATPEEKSEKPRPNARELAKAETREALILAAMTEFADHGLEAPSLDAICARAGYTRGAFYVHFRDRDELIAAVMERIISLILDTLIVTGDAALDLERTVRMFADAVRYGAFPPTSSVRSHHVLGACARSSLVREQYVALLDEARARVMSVVREGQQAKSVRSDVQADQISLLLVGLVMAVQTLVEIGVPFDVGAAADAVLRMLRPAQA